MIRSSTYCHVRLTAPRGDDLAEQREREVRVVVRAPGRSTNSSLAATRSAPPRSATLRRPTSPPPRAASPRGGRAAGGSSASRSPPVDVLLEPVVEVELPCGAQLHDRDRRERLRDRADAVLRLRRRLAAVVVVALPTAPAHTSSPLPHDRGSDRRQAVGLSLRSSRSSSVSSLRRHRPLLPPSARGTAASACSMSSSSRSRCVTARRTPGRSSARGARPARASRSSARPPRRARAPTTSSCTKFVCTSSRSTGQARPPPTPRRAGGRARGRRRAARRCGRARRARPPRRCPPGASRRRSGASRCARGTSARASRRSARRAGSRDPSTGRS